MTRAALRRRLGLDGQFVVGWVGSFRRFHAIENAVEAMVGLEGATLLLVGDGPERPRIEALARSRNVTAVFTGTVAHDQLPLYLATMDAALVTASRDASFHYSPLKLAEYLAAGLPVVAPGSANRPSPRRRGRRGARRRRRRARDDTRHSRTPRRPGPAGRNRPAAARAAARSQRRSWDDQVRRITEAVGRGT